MPTARVVSTKKANTLIDRLREKHGTELMFHQSGGCCDGSAPMCFEVGDFMVGSRDVKVGEIHGCEFFMSPDQFEYMKNTHLTIDVVEGRGSSFSIEIPLGLRFITISRLFTPEEAADLEDIEID
ncbi:MAG: DUF779 domain-containing protein [Sulfurovum sp.]|nr:DUF779 domain-containing protein [Sulfurovum sp.]MCB4745189.1 DUF779 domain-containing protein [Sulfurovum sp.]MCB4746726.1 DUF779 domain-containing protein [Sulfurovum sp.]MCB4747335.1 DUF779 domain-containing protein [Sulfurovum sp.]MCB4748645.1 DUF779 domain-containing protein [Sulfurovum sp.]